MENNGPLNWQLLLTQKATILLYTSFLFSSSMIKAAFIVQNRPPLTAPSPNRASQRSKTLGDQANVLREEIQEPCLKDLKKYLADRIAVLRESIDVELCLNGCRPERSMYRMTPRDQQTNIVKTESYISMGICWAFANTPDKLTNLTRSRLFLTHLTVKK